MQEERESRSHRLPGWLVFTVLRVLAFAVPLVLTLLLGLGPLLAAIVAAVVGLCVSVIFLSRQRGRYAQELAALRVRPDRGMPGATPDEVAEDSAIDAAGDQNASAAARPKP